MYAIWDGGISVTAKSEGNDDRIKHYFRDSSIGYYIIDLSVYKVYAPAGTVLAGWTGGYSCRSSCDYYSRSETQEKIKKIIRKGKYKKAK